MARGWESKSVESQQAEREQDGPRGARLTPEEREGRQRREAAALSLTRVREELARATQPAHRAMLERAAAALEAELNAER